MLPKGGRSGGVGTLTGFSSQGSGMTDPVDAGFCVDLREAVLSSVKVTVFVPDVILERPTGRRPAGPETTHFPISIRPCSTFCSEP